MTKEQMAEFCKPARIASLVTLREDGSPHVAPVWFHFDGSHVYISANYRAVKLKNLQKNPSVALCVCNHERPYQYISFHGTAEVLPEYRPDIMQGMALRYQGPQKGPEYADRVIKRAQSRMIKITPTKVLSNTAPT